MACRSDDDAVKIVLVIKRFIYLLPTHLADTAMVTFKCVGA